MITEEPKVFVPTGNWIQTFTGGRFYPTDPQVDDVKIRDIAHALSNQCRFAGHTRKFYSIAQHCYLVSQVCDPADALDGLLHDAAEAYMCDMPRPIKYSPGLEGFKELEKKIEAVIQKRFDLGPRTSERKRRRQETAIYRAPGPTALSVMGRRQKHLGHGPEGRASRRQDRTLATANKAETMFLMRFILLDNRRTNRCLPTEGGGCNEATSPKVTQGK